MAADGMSVEALVSDWNSVSWILVFANLEGKIRSSDVEIGNSSY